MIVALLRLIAQGLHVALMLAAAPLLVGLVGHLRARMLGSAGPSPLQPWRRLIRLARKQPVVTENASPVFAAGVLTDFAASLAAAALVPSFALGMTTAPASDLLVLAGLLALARAALALAAMDAGTAAAGRGASRAMTRAVLAEPALLLVIFALALASGGSDLDAMATLAARGAIGFDAARGLALTALAIVATAMTRRDAALLAECSGRHLALLDWAAALRLLLVLSLAVAVFVPFGAAAAAGLPLLWPLGLLAWAAKIGVLAAALAVLETATVRLRAARVPQLLGIAVALAALAVLLLCVGQGFA